MQSLHYDFVANSGAVATALGFTLKTGVHTAIIGTTSPKHMQSNVSAASARDVPFEAIRKRWKQTASPAWVAQM